MHVIKLHFVLILFFLSLFKLSCTKKHHVNSLFRISDTLNFYYVMYYIVSEMYIGRLFLEDCFYFYSQQIVSITNENPS